MKFVCPLIVVEDIAASRYFYEQVLGQEVRFDFGANVTFKGDFAIHLKTHYQQLLGEPALYPVIQKAHNGELYFETEVIEAVHDRLRQQDVEFIHETREQPWGQRVMRVYDPDGHIVEIGETLDAVVWRFHRQGLSADEVSQRTSMPADFVERVIKDRR
ncbi:MAG: glyoxalase/bleomycin resistance/dioxygenase family protein [Desulforudis sp.]|nr:MAG: glyoxalase/bleomycin resistance/dioxygenase family protein [Desulforudis sp.]